jgi:acetate kinase
MILRIQVYLMEATAMKILVLNAGSSSQKSCLYAIAEDRLPETAPEPLWEAQIDWTHQQGVAEVKVKTAEATLQETLPFKARSPVMANMLCTLWQGKTQVIAAPTEIEAVGHRIVHGGQDYQDSTRITPQVKQAIDRLAILAPVHNPANLEGIEAIEQVLGDVPQVAVFDTAFHAHMPAAAAVYPVPYEWTEQGIRRYGFHGISHQYCAQKAAQILGQDLKHLKLITCHLGNGCSMAAIQAGQSIDTSMGFTPLDGLMMGSRSGSIDPSILLYFMRQGKYSVDQMDQALNKASGLLGVSGLSNDMRVVVEAAQQGNARAQLAIDLYVHRLRNCIGGMIATLNGLDALIFTAGVGENSALVRAATCAHLGYLGVKLDPDKNEAHPRDQVISTPDSTVKVLVIHTQEDWAIAQECWRLLRQ